MCLSIASSEPHRRIAAHRTTESRLSRMSTNRSSIGFVARAVQRRQVFAEPQSESKLRCAVSDQPLLWRRVTVALAALVT